MRFQLFRSRPGSRLCPPSCAALALLAALLLAPVAAVPAAAGMLGHGPVLNVGYSPDEDAADRSSNLALVSAGWRWSFDGADCIDDFFARAHTDFSWAVEPVIGGVFGDETAFEASVVPFLRFAPLGWENVVPYFEGGIGVAFTSLENYGLGSVMQFSDNAGIGVTFGQGGRWSIAYRFRHISHAQLFGGQNDGLNAHFLAIHYQFPG